VPEASGASAAAELDQVRAAPPARIAQEIERALAGAGRNGRTVAEVTAAHAAGQMADLLEHAFAALLAPRWLRLHDVLEHDVMQRARLLATGGVEAVFAELAPRARLEHDRLLVAGGPRVLTAGSQRGLVPMPSAFIADDTVVVVEAAHRRSSIRPAGSAQRPPPSTATPRSRS
jgi:hypothetical protein